jgi:hypothetical protein
MARTDRGPADGTPRTAHEARPDDGRTPPRRPDERGEEREEAERIAEAVPERQPQRAPRGGDTSSYGLPDEPGGTER